MSAACVNDTFTPECVGPVEGGLLFTVRAGFPGARGVFADYRALPAIGWGVSSSWADIFAMTDGFAGIFATSDGFAVEMEGLFFAPTAGAYTFTRRARERCPVSRAVTRSITRGRTAREPSRSK